MKVTIQLFNSKNRQAVFKAFLQIIENKEQIENQLRAQGVSFTQLSSNQVAVIKGRFDNLRFSTYTQTETTVRIWINSDDKLDKFLDFLKVILNNEDETAKILWSRGLVLENIALDDAQALKQDLEAEGARVTIEDDVAKVQYTISGEVRSQATGSALAGVDIRATFQSKSIIRMLDARSDLQGYYTLYFDSSFFDGQSQPISVRFDLSKDKQPLNSESDITDLKPQNYVVDIQVLESETDEAQYVVLGKISDVKGSPLGGTIVYAYDRDLRSEELLGQQETDGQGYYEISYNRNQFRRAEKVQADLMLRLYDVKEQPIVDVDFATADGTPLSVLNDPGTDGVSITIPIWFNAPALAEINGTVTDPRFQGLSEYEGYLQDLTPLLDGVVFSALTETDISFLAAESKIDAQHIAFLRLAFYQQDLTQIIAPAFYGLFRQNMPTDLALLLVQSPEHWLAAMKQALAVRIIPRVVESQLDDIMAQLQELLPRYIAGNVPGSKPIALTNLLASVLPDALVREQFITEYARYDGKDESAFWQRIQSLPEFQNGVSENIRFTFQVNPLTFNYLPLVQALQQQRQEGRLQNAKDLVRLDEMEWRALITANINNQTVGMPEGIPGDTVEEKQENYAAGLTRLAEAAFPTAAIAAKLEQDKELPQRQDLQVFLTNNPDFDFETTPFRSYVLEHGDQALNDVQNPETIAAAQRIFKLAPRFHLMKPLLIDGFTSALAINQLGEARFVANYADPFGGEAQAKLVYRLARTKNALALAYLTKFHMGFNWINPWIIPGIFFQPDDSEGSTTVPDLQTLFGSLTSCQCEHCQSIYSPAAYLVDSLNFLKNNEILDDFQSRRPDIGSILLTCENTHTPLPFVDLVNEILETAISPKIFLSPATDFIGDLSSRLISERLSNVLSDLSADAEIVLITKNPNIAINPSNPDTIGAWVIHDHNAVYEIVRTKRVANRLDVVFSPQTTGTAEELLATPEHTNAQAYVTLSGSSAIYPNTLPFDLWFETARVYLTHLGSSRAEIMRLFQQSAASEDQIAWEALGLTPNHASIIQGYYVIGDIVVFLPQFYGYASADDSATLTRNLSNSLPNLLSRANLTYAEFLEVLDTQFVNPGRIVILDTPQGADCNLNKYKLAKHSAAGTTIIDLDGENIDFFERLHRFLRLYRVLGWSIQELDWAIQALGESVASDTTEQKLLNYNLLQDLSNVKFLADELRLSVEELLSFWGPINTAGVNALYQRLFQNKIISNPVNTDFELADDRVNLKIPVMRSNTDHISVMLAAFRISAADLDSLSPDDGTDQALDLAALSDIFRYVLLARSLHLRIPELLSLRQLTEIDPFSSPSQTRSFVSLAERVKESDFSLTELAYLFLHEPNSAAILEPDDEWIAGIVRTLQTRAQIPLNQSDGVLSSEQQLQTELTNELSLENIQRLPDLTPSEIDAAMVLLREDWSRKPSDEQASAGRQFTEFFGGFLANMADA